MRDALADELVEYVLVNSDKNYGAQKVVTYWNEGVGATVVETEDYSSHMLNRGAATELDLDVDQRSQ